MALLPWLHRRAGASRLAVTAGTLLIVAAGRGCRPGCARRTGAAALTEQALVVGDGPQALELARLLDEHPELGLRRRPDSPRVELPGLGPAPARISRVIV